MAVNKVVYGGNTLIDLTSDTATASDVAQGKTFHLADGTQATGTASGGGGEEIDPPNDGKVHLFINVLSDGCVFKPKISRLSSGVSLNVDWGDGSTSTVTVNNPSHTYEKAGLYEITMQASSGYWYCSSSGFGASNLTTSLDAASALMLDRAYFYDPNIHLSASANTFDGASFKNCVRLRKLHIGIAVTTCNAMQLVHSLVECKLPQTVTALPQYMFRYCTSLSSIEIPVNVASIGASAFIYCRSLKEVHVLSETPPSAGTNMFSNTPSDMVIYVPSASLEAYQTAENWSTYASQMVGE